LRVFPLVSRSQKVYRIKVRDNQGEILAGWARVGGWWFGLFSNTVVVKWDSELAPGKPLVPGVPIDCPKWLEKWAVPPPDPALEETYKGPRCVACRHPIAAGVRFCPKCDWTQPD